MLLCPPLSAGQYQGKEAIGERDKYDQKHPKGPRGEPLKAHSPAVFFGRSQLVPSVPEWNGAMRLYTTKVIGLFQEAFPLCGGAVGGAK